MCVFAYISFRCRKYAEVPSNGGKGFPTNYIVANLLEQIIHHGSIVCNYHHPLKLIFYAEIDRTTNKTAKLCSGKHAPMEVALYCTTCTILICHSKKVRISRKV
jgi:hypothetical protein